jgi:hypothetical protein
MVTISIPPNPAGHAVDIYGRIATLTRRRVSVFEDTLPAGHADTYRKSIPLAPGQYRADIVVKDLVTGITETGARVLDVK